MIAIRPFPPFLLHPQVYDDHSDLERGARAEADFRRIVRLERGGASRRPGPRRVEGDSARAKTNHAHVDTCGSALVRVRELVGCPSRHPRDSAPTKPNRPRRHRWLAAAGADGLDRRDGVHGCDRASRSRREDRVGCVQGGDQSGHHEGPQAPGHGAEVHDKAGVGEGQIRDRCRPSACDCHARPGRIRQGRGGPDRLRPVAARAHPCRAPAASRPIRRRPQAPSQATEDCSPYNDQHHLRTPLSTATSTRDRERPSPEDLCRA
jgi:hypothetical protein